MKNFLMGFVLLVMVAFSYVKTLNQPAATQDETVLQADTPTFVQQNDEEIPAARVILLED